MKKKSVIAINLCLIASIVTLFGNKIYMLYIGDCHQLWEEAQTHYVNRQYEKARELLEKIARIDTAHHAQYLTGDMYLKGLGGEIDYDKALKLFHQSAAGGNTYAENNIGFMYTYGLGVTKDYSQAFKWLNRAATQGNPEAQIGMGSLYKNGWGVRKDCYIAMTWYLRSVAHGNTDAMNNIGYLYKNGLGVPQDFEEAFFGLKKQQIRIIR